MRGDYRVMYWYGDIDGQWSETARRRYLGRDYNGLVIVPGGSWVPGNLGFVHDLPNLRYFCLEQKMRRDIDAFRVASLEELSLITGSPLPVPLVTQPNLTRLALTDRQGIDVANRWPNLKELRLGGWRGLDCGILEGAASLTRLHLEGRRQVASLDGIEFCRNLETLEVLQVALGDLSPLSEFETLRELKLMASPRSRHRVIDLSVVNSPVLEKVWLSDASSVLNVSHLARSQLLREVRLLRCGIEDVGRVSNQFPSRVKIVID